MKIDVMFRKEKSGYFKDDIYALFPYEIATRSGEVMCYMHVGQHSAADYNHCINTSKPAKPEEYADLKKELEDIGYELNIISRMNYDKYLNSCYLCSIV